MRTDAEIIEQAREAQLNRYLDQQSSASDLYDECLEKIDNETAELRKQLAEIIRSYASQYNIDAREILDEMIYPSIESEVF